jgi:tRNA dimethylallyltransferase
MTATKIGLQMERSHLIEKLDERVAAMYAAGLIDETRSLLTQFPRTARPFGAIGYAEAAAVVNGEMDVNAAIAETKRRTRAYAKRQMTWLRSERNVQWIDATSGDDPYPAAMRLAELSEGSE